MSNEDVDIYQVLSSGTIKSFTQSPIIYYPILTQIEYDKGIFDRFFLKSASDKNAPIIEVEESEYRSFIDNPFYLKSKISWKITGSINPRYENGILLEQGVSEYNSQQLKFAEKNIPELRNKVKDYFEFYKAD